MSRCLRQDFLLAYKMLFALLDPNPQDFFTIVNSGYETRGHKNTILLASHSRVDVRKYFFSERVIPVKNNPAVTETDFANLQAFKHFIAKADLSTFLTICMTCIIGNVVPVRAKRLDVTSRCTLMAFPCLCIKKPSTISAASLLDTENC